MKKIILLGLVCYFFLLVCSRFYNVAFTARFTQDESGFLVRTHQIYEEKKLTLIGQVNEQGKVFGSLSVYMLLPFAMAGNFEPQAMFYGAAFWGVVTSIVILGLSYLINRRFLFPVALLTIFWFPLLQSGRWAWNPNFVPLWVSLGLIFYLLKKPWAYFLTGICLGLTVHHHYYAIFAAGFFCLITGFKAILRKQYFQSCLIWSGFALALLPFVIFDLRHPPGLFFNGAASQTHPVISLTQFWIDTWELLLYLIQVEFLIWLFLLLAVFLFVYDLKNRTKAWLYLSPVLFERLMLWLQAPYFFHYYLVIIPFLIVWIIYPRTKKVFICSYLMLAILIMSGVFRIVTLLLVPPVIPDLPTQVAISKVLSQDITEGLHKNVNIAVLASKDHDVQADRYRDVLLSRDNVRFDSHDEYFHSDHLYVISTANESTIRQDQAPEMHNFQNGLLFKKLDIAKSGWFVYHFSKSKL